MIDIHNHLIFGVDDGSKSVEESIDILKDLYEYGYRHVILTPHYIRDTKYNNPARDNYRRMLHLQRILDQNGVNLKLHLGNEIYMDDDIIDLLKRGEVYSLNGTHYLLVELPMDGEYPLYEEIFKDLISKGCKIILAHPERYYSFQSKYDLVEELYESGILFQCNLESILGSYGLKSKKLFKRLLKEKKISFLATDIHHNKRDFSVYDKAKKKICKYITEEEYKKLLETNHLFD